MCITHNVVEGRPDRLSLKFALLRTSIYYVYQGARSFANMPGNPALCEPIDLQSERPSMNRRDIFYTGSFYVHSIILILD